jgi:flagellar basal body-associated protein FliL
MSPADAAKLLDLPADTPPEQLEARFLELRRKFEDKIAKAPTPGLQAKYRESLAEITTAFEILTLAADSSSLPVTQKQGAGSKEHGVSAGGPVSAPAGSTHVGSPLAGGPAAPGAASSRRKSGSKEFIIVAVIAVLLLGAGGWFVMKTRADNAEAARVAAEMAAKKQADEQAELTRVNALKTSLRTKLAEIRVDWEARESELQDAERRTNELKSELRGLRDAPAAKKAELSAQVTAQELYTQWLKAFLLRHPAKIARARAEELLQAGAHDEAAKVVEEINAALQELTKDIDYRREYLFGTTASVRLESKPAGVAWTLTDTYGRSQTGVTPARVTDLPLTHVAKDGVPVAPFESVKRGEFTIGKIEIRFARKGWPDVTKSTTATDDTNELIQAEFPEGSVSVRSQPAGVPFVISQVGDDRGWTATGRTPAKVDQVPVGRVRVELVRPGFANVSQVLEVAPGKVAETVEIDQRAQPVRIKVAEPAAIFIDDKAVASNGAEVTNLAPGEHTLRLVTAGYKAYRTKFTTKQIATPIALSFSFKELAVENITCSACSGSGRLNRQQRCNQCNGTTRVDCADCKNGVSGYVMGDYGGGVMGQKMVRCTSCNGRGYFSCTACTNGIYHWQDGCPTCSGDGKVSKLQLSQ